MHRRVADENGNIVGPPQTEGSRIVASEATPPVQTIAQPANTIISNTIIVRHQRVPAVVDMVQPSSIVVQHHPVVVHVPPMTVWYKGGTAAGAGLADHDSEEAKV